MSPGAREDHVALERIKASDWHGYRNPLTNSADSPTSKPYFKTRWVRCTECEGPPLRIRVDKRRRLRTVPSACCGARLRPVVWWLHRGKSPEDRGLVLAKCSADACRCSRWVKPVPGLNGLVRYRCPEHRYAPLQRRT